MRETPLYATLLYEVRRALDVSFDEYVYLDMVHKLSYGRWCKKSLDNTAYDLGITKRGTMKMRDRLIERGYLVKNVKGELKVTKRYIKLAVVSVDKYKNAAVNKVPEAVNKVHFAGEQSSPKNNNRYTENFSENKKAVEKSDAGDPRGTYSPAKERIRKMLEEKKQLSLT